MAQTHHYNITINCSWKSYLTYLCRYQGWGRIPAAPPPGTLCSGWPWALPRSPPPLPSFLRHHWSSCLSPFPSLCTGSSPGPPGSSPPAPHWSSWLGLSANWFLELAERCWCRCLGEAWGNRTLQICNRWDRHVTLTATVVFISRSFYLLPFSMNCFLSFKGQKILKHAH